MAGMETKAWHFSSITKWEEWKSMHRPCKTLIYILIISACALTAALLLG